MLEQSNHNVACCWHCSFFRGSSGPIRGCFLHRSLGPVLGFLTFFTALSARVSSHTLRGSFSVRLAPLAGCDRVSVSCSKDARCRVLLLHCCEPSVLTPTAVFDELLLVTVLMTPRATSHPPWHFTAIQRRFTRALVRDASRHATMFFPRGPLAPRSGAKRLFAEICFSLLFVAFFGGYVLLARVWGGISRSFVSRLIFRGPFRWPFRGSLRAFGFPCFLAAKLFVVSRVSSSVKSQTGEPSREEGRRPSGPLQGPNIWNVWTHTRWSLGRPSTLNCWAGGWFGWMIS